MKKWLLLILLLPAMLSHAMPLPADQVFQIRTKQTAPDALIVEWDIKPGYFLYKDRIRFDSSSDLFSIGTVSFPQPQSKTDHQGRTYYVYRNKLSLSFPVLAEHPGEGILNVHFQGCADDGFCYPPESRAIKLGVNSNLTLSTVNLESPSTQTTPPTVADESLVNPKIMKAHWFMTILSFFGLGLLLSFTPCILPMVPVLSGIIVGHGESLSTRKAFLLSLSYVLSMAVTYSIVGATVALLGSNLQIIMQAPWIIVLFSLLFVVLALSMFGFFELKLPLSWQVKLAGTSHRQSNGHYLGAAIMGCLSTLILSPCITAPLIGVLGYIAQTGNVFSGTVTLFFLGLGMGTPLLLIGTSAGKWLPAAGLWMNTVKGFFGIMLLAVAIYLLSRLLPGPVVMALWAVLLVFSGIYSGALQSAHNRHDKFRQGAGILMLLYGLLLLIGASMGNTNPLQPLAYSHTYSAAASSQPIAVKTLAEINQALNAVDQTPVLLDFYADWCASCKIMEATVLSDSRVQEALQKFRVLRVNITENNAEDKKIMQHFRVIAPPTFLFFDRQGQEIAAHRLVGEVSEDNFLARLKALDEQSAS